MAKKEVNADLDPDGFPSREGTYLVKGILGDDGWQQIEVYTHPVKGLCVYADDVGMEGSGDDDRYNCHVSVQNVEIGIIFGKRIGD